jgi:hypothetical protein
MTIATMHWLLVISVLYIASVGCEFYCRPATSVTVTVTVCEESNTVREKRPFDRPRPVVELYVSLYQNPVRIFRSGSSAKLDLSIPCPQFGTSTLV